MWIIKSPQTKSRNGTIPQLKHAKKFQPRGKKALKCQALPSLHNTQDPFLCFMYFSFLINLKITNAFWWNLLIILLSATLKFTSNIFFSKPQRLDEKFYFLKDNYSCWLLAVQEYLEVELMSHNLPFSKLSKRERKWLGENSATFPKRETETLQHCKVDNKSWPWDKNN